MSVVVPWLIPLVARWRARCRETGHEMSGGQYWLSGPIASYRDKSHGRYISGCRVCGAELHVVGYEDGFLLGSYGKATTGRCEDVILEVMSQ